MTDRADDLTYTGAMDFKDGADKAVEYVYDANGNMTRDRNKKNPVDFLQHSEPAQ
ncbi:MAG: hypothetical protein L6U16_13525 [Porphyromonadaceae bacterium]|nr:MAG: hypothetical protein L6U16_13525 [Porphyromonadaceae bacterium]